MDAAIACLRRELRALQTIRRESKKEFYGSIDGSLHQDDLFRDVASLHREIADIETAIELLLGTQNKAATRRRT